jgi:acylphosphatase
MASHLIITGKVQGVGYRASFEARARALGLSGWVRNRVDGSVEALVRGDTDAVEQMIAWARRSPSSARVDNVEVAAMDDGSVPEGRFEVLATR